MVAAGLLSGRVVDPITLVKRPELAAADPQLSGGIVVECVGSCAEKLREVLPKCAEAEWTAKEPNRLRLKVRGIRVSELFDAQLRLVEPFRAPPPLHA